jgi:dipeptidyl aminopeptidase/acylaminoacyl peptidase
VDSKARAGLTESGAAFQADDLCRYHLITSIHGVRACARLVWAVKSVDAEKDTYRSAIWLHEQGHSSQITEGGDALDKSPVLSPSGDTIAFLSDRGLDAPQVHLIDATGGKPRKLTDLEEGAISAAWRPDGKALLVLADVKGPRHGPEVATRIPYKTDGLGFTADTSTHVFVVDARDGAAKQVTHGSFEVRSASWSPDGKRIAFSRTRDGRDAHRTDIWVMDADGGSARQITRDVASVQSPSWSPDGRYILFGGSEIDGDSVVRPWLHDVAKGDSHAVGDDGLEVVGQPVWREDSREVAVVVAHRGREQVARVPIPGGTVERTVVGDRHVSGIAACGDRLAFFSHALAGPNQVFIADWNGEREEQLTHLNEWWNERKPIDARLVSFEVPDGAGGQEQVEGWLYRPSGAEGALPLLLDVHGGPASYVLLAYPSKAYWPVLLSHGWSVLALNAAGSGSYGREFATRLNGRWGELDFPQWMSAVEQLRGQGLADERIAIAGKSYGGYLAAWAIGQTAQFKAAVVSAPVLNLATHFGTSDSGYYADAYALKGYPWTARRRWEELSPCTYAHKIKTPTLILQGKDDERCPRSESEALFTTILASGDTPAELAMYPKGGHHFYEDGKPSFRVDAVRRTVDWLTKWVR